MYVVMMKKLKSCLPDSFHCTLYVVISYVINLFAGKVVGLTLIVD